MMINNNNTKLDFKKEFDISMASILGTGSYGSVYAAKIKLDN